MRDFKVTEHFTFHELTITHDHPDLLDANRDYFAIEPYLGRLTYASEYLLENIRDEVRLPIIVTSGGRYPELNAAAGGSKTSQHMFGNYLDGAFDFHVIGMPISEVAKRIWYSGLSFYQMRVYVGHGFIHIGMPREKNNLQVAWIGGVKPEWAK